MSKSVDETVVDFFTLLLRETELEETLEAVSTSVNVMADVQQRTDKTHEVASAVSRIAEIDSPPKNDIEPVIALPKEPVAEAITAPVKVPPLAASYKDEDEVIAKKQALEKLLAPMLTQTVSESTVSVKKKAPEPVKVRVAEDVSIKPVIDVNKVIEADVNSPSLSVKETPPTPELRTQTGTTPPSITKDLQEQLDDEFQVLFFKVAGLTLAVPLVSLGGIVKVERINSIFGRPDWFMGVQTHREQQLNIVDTGAWVMPEKYDESLAQSINYQYLVLLEDSNWGLACESLINAVRIKKSAVNWRSKAGKRPWLAGVVKEQMCGILHVQALIEMLNLGLGCQDPIG